MDIPETSEKNKVHLKKAQSNKVTLKGQVWFSIYITLLLFKTINFVLFCFVLFFILEHTSDFFYFKSIQRRPVLQVKIVTLRLWMIYQVQNFLFFAECLMRWDSFLTTWYRLVSKAWTILLKSRTFLRKAINCYGIDNVFSCKARE